MRCRHARPADVNTAAECSPGTVIMSEKYDIDEEEAELFRASVGKVRPLTRSRVEQRPQPPAPRARFRRQDEAEVLRATLEDAPEVEVEPGEQLFYARAGVQHKITRKLRRGQYAVQQALDLHGMTVAAAREATAQFIRDCVANDVRCVRIIHGKGLRSAEATPAIKSRIGGWLARSNDVLAYASARPADGGAGALYVLLRKK